MALTPLADATAPGEYAPLLVRPERKVSLLEGVFYAVGLVSLCLGWYFNVRYTHTYKNASYVNYTRMLFTNWAADSAAQDYTITNVLLLPLWSIESKRTVASPPNVHSFSQPGSADASFCSIS